jgi:aldehyde:ferredoxin oxidoreductase
MVHATNTINKRSAAVAINNGLRECPNRTPAMQHNAALPCLYFSAEVLIKYALAVSARFAWRNKTPAMQNNAACPACVFLCGVKVNWLQKSKDQQKKA